MTDPVILDGGNITLYCGDAMEIMPTIPAGECDCAIMDPPYVFASSSAGTKISMWADTINNARWFADLLRETARIVRCGTLWMFTSWKTIATLQKASHDADMPINSMVAWDKDWIGPGGVVGLRPSYEMISLWCLGDKAIEDRGIADVWKFPWSSRKPNGHPAEKPEALIERIIEVSTPQTILDPFGGSGTVCAVAARHGIPAIGVELEDKWNAGAVKRIQTELDLRDGQGPLMRQARLIGEPKP